MDFSCSVNDELLQLDVVVVMLLQQIHRHHQLLRLHPVFNLLTELVEQRALQKFVSCLAPGWVQLQTVAYQIPHVAWGVLKLSLQQLEVEGLGKLG